LRGPLVGHQAIEEWTGASVLTLADLIPRNARAVVVGVNPTPSSVEAGHYYQGQLGQLLLRRLRHAELLVSTHGGWDDDHAHQEGIGFTDPVKRPTGRASELRREELDYGVARLRGRLAEANTPIVVFTFKTVAVTLLGPFVGSGLLPASRIGDSRVFVRPSPYALRDVVRDQLRCLRTHLGA
jgi:double-stranded uracil-DNA glycosylase